MRVTLCEVSFKIHFIWAHNLFAVFFKGVLWGHKLVIFPYIEFKFFFLQNWNFSKSLQIKCKTLSYHMVLGTCPLIIRMFLMFSLCHFKQWNFNFQQTHFDSLIKNAKLGYTKIHITKKLIVPWSFYCRGTEIKNPS